MSTRQPLPMSVSVSAHLQPETEFAAHVVAAENRGVLRVDGPGMSNVKLFGHRAELVRLRDAFAALVTELDNERAALAESLQTDESAA